MVNQGPESGDSGAESEWDAARGDLPSEAQIAAARTVLGGRKHDAREDYSEAIAAVGQCAILGVTTGALDKVILIARAARQELREAELDAVAFLIVFGNAPAGSTEPGKLL